MKKIKKLNLDQLQVKSFVTHFDGQAHTIKGGETVNYCFYTQRCVSEANGPCDGLTGGGTQCKCM